VFVVLDTCVFSVSS